MVTPIIGSYFTKTAKIIDPFATFKFHVEVGDITEAAFTDCSGLDMSTEVFEYQEGGLNEYVHKIPGRTKVSNVTLKRGFATSNEIFDWYKEMEEKLLGGKRFDFRQVTITLYSSADRGKLARWTLDKAFPVKWVGPALKTDEATIAVETLEFAHHGITVDMESLGKKSGLLGKLIKTLT
ncbi:phage tail protein [Chloroflexota bacterium]